MGNEHLLDINAEPAEDQGAGIGGGGPLCVEVDLLAGEIGQGFDFRADEDVQLGRKQAQDRDDLLLNLRNLRLVLLERVAVDDRYIDSLQIQKVVDVLGRTARHDRKNGQVAVVVHDPGNLGREMNGRSFEQACRQADGAGIRPITDVPFGCDGLLVAIVRSTKALCARFREHKKRERKGKEPRENRHDKIFSKMNLK